MYVVGNYIFLFYLKWMFYTLKIFFFYLINWGRKTVLNFYKLSICSVLLKQTEFKSYFAKINVFQWINNEF